MSQMIEFSPGLTPADRPTPEACLSEKLEAMAASRGRNKGAYILPDLERLPRSGQVTSVRDPRVGLAAEYSDTLGSRLLCAGRA